MLYSKILSLQLFFLNSYICMFKPYCLSLSLSQTTTPLPIQRPGYAQWSVAEL